MTSAVAKSSAFSDRVDQPVDFWFIDDHRGSVDGSVKLMYLWRLSDSLSSTFQSCTLPRMEFEANVISMCD